MRMTDIAIRRPVTTTMVTLGGMVLGLMAVARLGVDLFPNVDFPVVAITTVYPGASPLEVEDRVTRPIEEKVSGINGVDRVRSTSRDSVSTVIVQFETDVDIKRAVNDSRDQVALAVAQLPSDVEEPIVSRIDPSAAPVLTYTVASETRDPVETRRFVEDVLRPAIERVDGVAAVEVEGGAEREVRVSVDPERLEPYGMSLAEVSQVLRMETLEVPSGRLALGATEQGVKATGRVKDVEALRRVVVRTLPDGSQVPLSVVADVELTEEEIRTKTRVNGVEAVAFHVQKQGGSNTVAIVDEVEEALAKLNGSLPKDVSVTRVLDGSGYIRINIENLWFELIVGGLMAVLVIYLFMLDWRSTFISSLALPTSIITTFFVMWQLGFSLNIMSMLGLTLSIGILIDDSVVVRENIYRHLEMGADPITAAREGTREIAMAVLATTLTIIAVFMPVAFTGGMIGGFFREFGITVSVACVISLIVSFTLDPMLSARVTQVIDPDHHDKQRRNPIIGPLVRFYDWMDDAYRGLLAWTLRHKWVPVTAGFAALVGSCALVPYMGQEFAGRGDRGELTVQLELASGSSLEATDAVARRVEQLLRAQPEVKTVSTTLGPDEQVNAAAMKVLMSKATERERAIGDIMEDLRAEFRELPGVSIYMREAGVGNSDLEEAPITLFVRGPDYAELAGVAYGLLDIVRATPGTRDLAINYQAGAVEQRVSVDRVRAADRGLSFANVAGTLRTALTGDRVSKFDDGGKDVDVRVVVADEAREDLSALGRLEIPPQVPGAAPVPLSDVLRVDAEPSPSTIERYDRQRQITITGNVYGRSLGEVLADLNTRLEEAEVPAGYSFKFAGEAEQMEDTFVNLGLALALAILFIYFVLASQFESFIHPLTIMTALPLAVVGALLGLFMMEMPMGLAPLIGMILLMGLATKNSILLVDYAGQLRRDEGMSLTDALMTAGPTRLRPILMTSAAIVLGMLPTAMSTGEGSEFQAPMAVAVIGGVITSTLLTLIVVPAIYTWFDRLTPGGFKEWRAEVRARKAARRGEPTPGSGPPGTPEGAAA